MGEGGGGGARSVAGSTKSLARQRMEATPNMGKTVESQLVSAASEKILREREELLESRPSMQRGARFWGAVTSPRFQTATTGGGQSHSVMKANEAAALEVNTVKLTSPPGISGGGAEDDPPPKPHTANTGFCSECDSYIRAALADQFGYKVSALVLDSATVKPTTLADVEKAGMAVALEAKYTRSKHHRNDTFRRYDANEFAQPREANESSKAQRALDKAVQASADQRTESARLAAREAREAWENFEFDEPDSKIARRILPNDRWVQDYDYESGHFFYYNVTTGARQWVQPPVQPWHVVDGQYVPMTAPKVFPATNYGELEAYNLDQLRLKNAQKRATASIRVDTARREGVVPASLAGIDIGPASGGVRVSHLDGNTIDDTKSAAGLWRNRTLVNPPPQKEPGVCRTQ